MSANNGGDDGFSLPDSLSTLASVSTAGAAFLVAFAENPVSAIRDAVITIVVEWFVAGTVELILSILTQLGRAYSLAAQGPAILADGAIDIGQMTVRTGLNLLFALGDVLTSLVGGVGPAGPILGVVFVAGFIYVYFEVGAIALDTVLPSLGDLLRSLRGIFR